MGESVTKRWSRW